MGPAGRDRSDASSRVGATAYARSDRVCPSILAASSSAILQVSRELEIPKLNPGEPGDRRLHRLMDITPEKSRHRGAESGRQEGHHRNRMPAVQIGQGTPLLLQLSLELGQVSIAPRRVD